VVEPFGNRCLPHDFPSPVLIVCCVHLFDLPHFISSLQSQPLILQHNSSDRLERVKEVPTPRKREEEMRYVRVLSLASFSVLFLPVVLVWYFRACGTAPVAQLWDGACY